MIYYNYKGQIAGEMRLGIFVKRVDRVKHFFRMLQGYGVSTDIIQKLAEDGCKEIRINEDGDTLYRISYDDFLKNGITKTFDDEQMFVPIAKFESKDLHQQSFMVE